MKRYLFNVQVSYAVEAETEEAALDLMSSDINYDDHPQIRAYDSDVLYVGQE